MTSLLRLNGGQIVKLERGGAERERSKEGVKGGRGASSSYGSASITLSLLKPLLDRSAPEELKEKEGAGSVRTYGGDSVRKIFYSSRPSLT